MTVSTQNYSATYGHSPRPSQLGAWSFLIGGREGEYTEFQFTGTYREALRRVKAEAKTIGRASSITVNA
jgi:uncharacterized protein YbjQ (UPF0145 family)